MKFVFFKMIPPFNYTLSNLLKSPPPPPPPPPPKGSIYLKHSAISREKHVYTLFNFLDEEIVETSPSFYLIDEENDDEKLEIL